MRKNRLRKYLLWFVIILLLLFISNNVLWKSLDYTVYNTFYLNVPEEKKALRKDITLLDLPHFTDLDESIHNFRLRLSDLLQTINALSTSDNKPNAVLIDIYFSSDTTDGLDALKNAINQLKQNGIKVYGVFDMFNYKKAASFEARNKEMATILYDSVFDGGRLHNLFFTRQGVVDYSSFLTFEKENGNYDTIFALPYKVAADYDTLDDKIVDYKSKQNFILPLGDKEELVDRTYKFVHSPQQTSNGSFEHHANSTLNIDRQHLIIGSIEKDTIKILKQRGPYLLAWALNDQLKSEPIAKQPMNSPWFILAMILFFSGLVLGLFYIIFQRVERLQFAPLKIALIAFFTALVLFIVFAIALSSVFNSVIPVGLTFASMLTVSVLAFDFTRKIPRSLVKGDQKFDIFISYSWSDFDFVEKKVYNEVAKLTKPDGKKLEIFFDRNTMDVGDEFTDDYLKGIARSKLFLPVMGEDYKDKGHCQVEFGSAIKREAEKKIKMYPLAFNFNCVPDHVSQFIVHDLSKDPDFITGLKRKLDEIFSEMEENVSIDEN